VAVTASVVRVLICILVERGEPPRAQPPARRLIDQYSR
jgi:hypothetical protein